jgi:drug/metabolite transporter (DMT)-like permease
VLTAVRYGIPALFVLGGVIMLILEPNSTGIEGLCMALGAALAVFYLNFLFRQGARGDEERAQEEAAREYFAKHGRWPDEPSR